MKVLMVTPFYHPVVTGGVESVVKNFSIKLSKIGVQADVMTFNLKATWSPLLKREKDEVDGIPVIRVPAFNFLPPRMHSPHTTFRVNLIPLGFKDVLRDYDIIHFHNDVDLSFPFFSLHNNRPKIFHCHVLDVTYPHYKRNFISRLILQNASDIYIVLSKLFADLLIDLGVPETKIRTLPNGIDTEQFKPSQELKSENLLLFVGRLDQKKGLPILLKALNYLKTSVQLKIIGPAYNAKYYQKIITLVEQTNKKTAHKITYLGAVNEEEKLKLYQKASIFLCPSISESFPMVNLEALSCGTPVVASDVGSISEVVRHNENGIMVPPKNPTELANAIQYLLDNEEVRRRFSENGRKWIIDNFSIDAVVIKLYRIYKEMMKII